MAKPDELARQYEDVVTTACRLLREASKNTEGPTRESEAADALAACWLDIKGKIKDTEEEHQETIKKLCVMLDISDQTFNEQRALLGKMRDRIRGLEEQLEVSREISGSFFDVIIEERDRLREEVAVLQERIRRFSFN